VKHWVSCRLFTVQADTDENGLIRYAAPIVRRFIGQPIEALLRWAQAHRNYRHETWE
jgi:hypothetical protein